MGQFENKAKRYAENLKHLRVINGLTRGQLAKKCGITPGSIAHYEKAEAMPNVLYAHAIAEVLGVTVEDMIEKTVAVEVKMK